MAPAFLYHELHLQPRLARVQCGRRATVTRRNAYPMQHRGWLDVNLLIRAIRMEGLAQTVAMTEDTATTDVVRGYPRPLRRGGRLSPDRVLVNTNSVSRHACGHVHGTRTAIEALTITVPVVPHHPIRERTTRHSCRGTKLL